MLEYEQLIRLNHITVLRNEVNMSRTTTMSSLLDGVVRESIIRDERIGEDWPDVLPPAMNATNSTLMEKTIDMQFNDGHLLTVVVYSVLFMLSSIANLTVFVVLLRQRRKSPSRIDTMLLNLVIADLLVTFLMMPLEVIWAITVSWLAGDFMCRLMSFFRVFGLYLSSYILVCISIDRYLAVLKPFNSNDKRGKMMITTAWIASFLSSLPQTLIFHVESHPNFEEYRQCTTFIEGEQPSYIMIYAFTVTLLMYVIPLIIIIFCYGSIYLEIFKKSQIRNCDSLRRSSIQVLGRAKRRTLRMTITIVIAFVVCWTPYTIITTWYLVDAESAQKLNQMTQRALFLFACANSCIDPLVYGIYNIRKKPIIKNMSLMHSSARRSQEFTKSDSRRTMISEVKDQN